MELAIRQRSMSEFILRIGKKSYSNECVLGVDQLVRMQLDSFLAVWNVTSCNK